MATKAAKSLTINATKFELANTLAVENGKLQLKAKDVVLSEVDVDTSFVIEMDDNQNFNTTGSKTCKAFDAIDLEIAIQAGRTIKMVAHNTVDSENETSNELSVVFSSCEVQYVNAQIALRGYVDSNNQLKQFLVPYETHITSINLY